MPARVASAVIQRAGRASVKGSMASRSKLPARVSPPDTHEGHPPDPSEGRLLDGEASPERKKWLAQFQFLPLEVSPSAISLGVSASAIEH
ncbi:hypothetical protein NL676_013977 [Syzygium grande]|nr:hypothetical protein NL676_013977 [Syzygium grande]